MLITRFASSKNTHGTQEDVNVEQFLSSPRMGIDKRTLPMFSFATFKDNRRHGDTFESIAMLGFDVDVDPVPSESVIRQALQKLSLQGWFLSTSSATALSPRWRLFIPLAHPVGLALHNATHKAIADLLGFPTGIQAVDGTRAWYVPARLKDGVFIYGSVDGSPVDPDLYANYVRPVERTPTVTGINADPPESTHVELVMHLVSCWPARGRRDECHMALSGYLAKLGFGLDWITRVVQDVSVDTGSEKAEARATMVQRTFDKLETGAPVAGFQKLQEIIGEPNARAITEILQIKLPRFSGLVGGDPVPFDDLPDASGDHQYSYRVGAAPGSNMRQASMSELVATLCDHPDWQNCLRWNTLSDAVIAINPPLKLDAENEKFSNADVTMVLMWLESRNIKCNPEQCGRAIEAAAKKIPWNPIEHYLKRCGALDGEGAIAEMCAKAMHITDPLSALMVRKQLIAAVRRALTINGVKVDSVLVFKGPQGKNKTQFIEKLFGAKYVKTNLSDIRSKDGVQELKGIWAVEFGELASVANTEIETLKEYVSRTVDKYRPSYGRSKIEVPRNCVFFGTTNAAAFLKDETGNRRWWIIELYDDIDLRWVDENRDLVWAEAYALAMAGEEHWIKGDTAARAEERTKEFMALDAWAQLVHDYCVGKQVVRVEEIYTMAICGGDPASPRTLDARVQARIQKILTIFGAKTGTHRIKGKPMRAWRLPDSFTEEIRVNGHVEMQETPEVQSTGATGPVPDLRGALAPDATSSTVGRIESTTSEPAPTRRYPSLNKYIKGPQ